MIYILEIFFDTAVWLCPLSDVTFHSSHQHHNVDLRISRPSVPHPTTAWLVLAGARYTTKFIQGATGEDQRSGHWRLLEHMLGGNV